MAKEELLKIRLVGPMKRAFIEHARAYGVTASERIRQLILADLEKRSPLTRYTQEEEEIRTVEEPPAPRSRRKSTAA